MLDVLRFALIGASAGAIFALLGLGVNVVFRASRVINFSHAAVAVTAAYAYQVFVGVLPTPLAVLLAIIVGMAIALVTELLIMRPLRDASGLTKAIATIGVLITLQAILNLRFGYNPLVVKPWLPTDVLTIGGLSIGADRVIIFVVGLALTAVLYVIYKKSSFGIATTALSSNPRSLAALGRWSPRSVSVINWMIGGALAGVGGVMLAPISSLSPPLTLILVMPILSAALLGNLSSFWLTFVGGVAIGIAQAQIGRLSIAPGLEETIPFVIIVILLAVRGSSLPQRGEVADKLPRIGSGRIPVIPVVVLVVVTFVLMQWVLSEKWVQALTTGIIAAVVLLSLVVVTGYAGQLSLASFALAGVAAFVSAQLVATFGWSFLPAALVGILATAPVGLIVGLPAVRTRGTSLAVVTLGLAVAFQAAVLDNASISNGTTGLNVGNPLVFGLDISSIFFPRRYGVFALIVFAIVALTVLNLRRSAAGRRMIAVRGNERAAASIGVSVARTKLHAFIVSGVIAGVGGVLLAFTNLNVVLGNPGGRFDPSYSINAISEVTVGGVGFVSGALIGTATEPGAVINQLLQFITSGSWFNLIGGILLLVTVVTAPSGIAANFQVLFGKIGARLRRKNGPARHELIDLEVANVQLVEAATVAVRDVTVTFGGHPALDSVELDIRSGRVLGIIGPNGAGKTTLVDAITGFNRPSSGSITLDGRDISRMSPTARARVGVARSFQALELFEDLTVLDNLLVASDHSRWYHTLIAGVVPGRPQLSGAARAAVQKFGLAHRLHDSPEDLSYGERRLLAIARALAGEPRVLLLDEPAAGLSAEERLDLRQLVRSLATDWGIAVLIIEHDVELVLGVSDEIVALDFGRVIARGTPDEVRTNPAVISAYLGTDNDADDDADNDAADTNDAVPSVASTQKEGLPA